MIKRNPITASNTMISTRVKPLHPAFTSIIIPLPGLINHKQCYGRIYRHSRLNHRHWKCEFAHF
jgi:hypothetical protein